MYLQQRSLRTASTQVSSASPTAPATQLSASAQSAELHALLGRVAETAGRPLLQASAHAGLTGASGRLPHYDAIQQAFGPHDVSGIRAHLGSRAVAATTRLGAAAFASGNAVAFSATPDLRMAAHEAAHVVQQRNGMAFYGLGTRPGDAGERHADAVADRVVQGRSASDLLGPVASERGNDAAPVQFWGGKFLDKIENLVANVGETLSEIPAQAIAGIRSTFEREVLNTVEGHAAMTSPALEIYTDAALKARINQIKGQADVKTDLAASIKDKYFGCEQHWKYATVVESLTGGRIPGIDALEMNPSGGIAGPGMKGIAFKSGPLHEHAIRHDATGFLMTYFGVGPGYGGPKPESPLSGQIEGILRELLQTSKLPDIGMKK